MEMESEKGSRSKYLGIDVAVATLTGAAVTLFFVVLVGDGVLGCGVSSTHLLFGQRVVAQV